MKDQVLYRKYRPGTFADVLGQDHITKVLEQSLVSGTFSQAYLFTGSRGTGKTSVARIFAKALGVSPEDIAEIDAASNRKVEDIEELRRGVNFFPFSSPFKVYIIDEVHMLTGHAFNALLKTLEEPPAHVIFILATTELDKVPETILSRCQTFTFRKPSERLLAQMIGSVADKEGVKIDEDAKSLIAFLGDGSFRDTQSLLQKVLSVSSGRMISREEVETLTGAPSLSVIQTIYNGLIEKDIDTLLAEISRASSHHIDMMLFAKLLLQTMRFSLLYRYSPALRDEIIAQHTDSYAEIVRRGAVEGQEVINSASVVTMIEAIERLSYASVPELPLELAMISLVGAELK